MVRLPKPGTLVVPVKLVTHVDAHVQVVAKAPEVIVPMQHAQVVEFFGVPLENAQDVVFVLDCSGSMTEAAQGRLVQEYQAPPAPAPAPDPNAPIDPAQPPPPDPNAPPPDPNAQPAPPAPVAPVSPTKIAVAQAELLDALQRLPVGTRMNVVFFNSELEAFAPGMIPLDEQGRTDLVSFIKGISATGSTALAPAMRTAFVMNAKRIVLLSDGLGNVGGGSESVIRDAREAMHGGVRIDTIGLGAGQDADLLGSLARESGGLYQRL